MECHDCGLYQRVPALDGGAVAVCRRCNATLRRFARDPVSRPLALTVTGLVLLVTASLLPFLSLSIDGRIQNASLLTGAVDLYRLGMGELSALILFTMLVAPAVLLGSLAYVLGALCLPRPPPGVRMVFTWVERVRPWAMIDVYMLGVIVAYVKLSGLASIVIGPALYALVGAMLAMVAATGALDRFAVWEILTRRGVVRSGPPPVGPDPVSCHVCGLITDAPPAGPSTGRSHAACCPRCGSTLHRRKRDPLTRAWAYAIAGVVLYIPANLLPIMTVVSFGRGEPDTILSGVKALLEAGMWPLALLVFFASITVPVLKLIGIVILLTSTHRRSAGRLKERTQLYRMVEKVGRWSMIDVFMISILVALVQIGSIATIVPGPGAICFAAVVVLTMLSAMAFDPRVMWDAAAAQRGNAG